LDWVSNNVPHSEYWYAVACSADGNKIVAASNSNTNGGAGAIFTTANGGAVWISNSVAKVNWSSVASSGDGRKLVACGSGSKLYTSNDGGANWTQIWGVIGFFTGAASSADGSKLLAVSNSGQIYTSIDSGANWVSNSAPELPWQHAAASLDGNLLLAAVPFADIYKQQSAPALNLAAKGNQGLLTWPWPSARFTVEHNGDLSTTNWQPLANLPTLTNWQYQLPVLLNQQKHFFRLKE
jgi:hypothetical protein